MTKAMPVEQDGMLAERLLQWWIKNRRDFPWRVSNDPYEILIAEIMLQRTRAEQVVPIYECFIKKFPTIQRLNRATSPQIKRYFERLGLLWRAGLVKQMASALITHFDGRVPNNRADLLSIPAIGDYVADAVLSFAYGQNVAVVDANVCRVVGRVFGMDWKGEARRKPVFKKTVDRLLPKGKAKEFNWAMIDHASLICLPRNPLCGICPLSCLCTYATAKGVKLSDGE
jgi:A/G-specific adenine glycosylase